MIQDDPAVVRAFITGGSETMLHMAALANRYEFVKLLVAHMHPQDLAIINKKGCTALCFAAVTGNVELARVMINKNLNLPTIRGSDGVLPILMAAMLGKRDMVEYLWEYNRRSSDDEENIKLVIACINANLFGKYLSLSILFLQFKRNISMEIYQKYTMWFNNFSFLLVIIF